MDVKTKEKIARWRKANPEKVAESQRRYREKKKAEAAIVKAEEQMRINKLNIIRSIVEYKMAVTRLLQFTLEVIEEQDGVPIGPEEFKELKTRFAPYIQKEENVSDEILKKYPKIPTFFDRIHDNKLPDYY